MIAFVHEFETMTSHPSDPFLAAPPHGTELLSALIDGECQAHELDALLDAGPSQRQAQDLAWAGYLALGTALRGQGLEHALPPSADFAVAVMAMLAAEQESVSAAPREQPAPPGAPLLWCLA